MTERTAFLRDFFGTAANRQTWFDLLGMAWPLVFAFAAGMSGTAVDSIYLARIGVEPLALFTSNVPLFSIVTYATAGCGVAATSILAYRLGQGDEAATRVFACALLVGIVTVLIGFLVIMSSYGLTAAHLGIPDAQKELARRFMFVWLVGEFFQAATSVGVGALKAYGDTRLPALANSLSIALRITIEFGYGLRYPMSTQSSLILVAVTNIVSWGAASGMALMLLRYRVVPRQQLSFFGSRNLPTYSALVKVALPMMGNTAFLPISLGILTMFVSRYGTDAIAGFGLGTRIETVALIVVQALSYSALTLIARAYGAGDQARVRAVAAAACVCMLAWGAVCWLAFLFAGPWLALQLTPSPGIAGALQLYLQILAPTYGLFGLYHLSASIFLATKRVGLASMAYVLRYLIVLVPAVLVLEKAFALAGVFDAIAVANVCVGAGLFVFGWQGLQEKR